MPPLHFILEFLLWCELLICFLYIFEQGDKELRKGVRRERVDILRTVRPTPGEGPWDNGSLGA